MSSESIRKFYEELYEGEDFPNPARDIYNNLRVKILSELIDDTSGPLLIIGCGSGKDLEVASKTHTLYAFDLSHNAVKKSQKEGAFFYVADATAIPFPEHFFSVIVCSEVLEHIPNVKNAIREIHRVLAKDGILVVSSPNWLSWFGLARWIGEKWFRRSFHSSDQPYDDWKTLWKYRYELSPEFKVEKVRGVWYLPPLHYKGRGLSRRWTYRLYRMFSPFENMFSKFLPFLGHLVLLRALPQNYQPSETKD